MEERAANEKIAMVYSSINSPDDLIPIISEEKESCFRIALRYTGVIGMQLRTLISKLSSMLT